MIDNLRYADDTILPAESGNDFKELPMKESEGRKCQRRTAFETLDG